MKKLVSLVVMAMVFIPVHVYAADEFVRASGVVLEHRLPGDVFAADATESQAGEGSYHAPILPDIDTIINLDQYGYVNSYENATVYSRFGKMFLLRALDQERVGLGIYVESPYLITEPVQGDWNIIYFMHTKKETLAADVRTQTATAEFYSDGGYAIQSESALPFGENSNVLEYETVASTWKLSDDDGDINTRFIYNDNVMIGIHRAYWEIHEENGMFIGLREYVGSLEVSDIVGQYGVKAYTHVVEDVPGEVEVELFEGMVYFHGDGNYTAYPFGVDVGITGTYSIGADNQLIISGYGRAIVSADLNTFAMELDSDADRAGLGVLIKVSDETTNGSAYTDDDIEDGEQPNNSGDSGGGSSGGGCFIESLSWGQKVK